jgi:MFS transporter, DHA3 family, macrolide efflux protein
MRQILQQRGLRLIFFANMVSMLGSGMNSAALTWYILKTTGSETALGLLVVLQTVPAMLMLPFTGVIIDREDRRRIVMTLDAARGLVILTIAILAFRGTVHLWQLYLMNVLVAAGFWMFWPTITALIQELTPQAQFVQSNTFLMAGVQGGWLVAGAIVGFVYNHIHLGGVLLLDFATYVFSFCCYFFVRRGRHVVSNPEELQTGERATGKNVLGRFLHELHDGLVYLKGRRPVVLMGASWSLFLGAMLTAGVITAPLDDRIIHGGAVGYGWMNGGWGIGAFVSTLYTPWLISQLHARRTVGLCMAVLSTSMFIAPYLGSVHLKVSLVLTLVVMLYFCMGSARGVGGTAISSSMMEMVPKHYMGRVQNTFYFFGTLLQLGLGFLVGAVAHRVGLTSAFAIVASVYLLSFLSTLVPGGKVKIPAEEEIEAPVH